MGYIRDYRRVFYQGSTGEAQEESFLLAGGRLHATPMINALWPLPVSRSPGDLRCPRPDNDARGQPWGQVLGCGLPLRQHSGGRGPCHEGEIAKLILSPGVSGDRVTELPLACACMGDIVGGLESL